MNEKRPVKPEEKQPQSLGKKILIDIFWYIVSLALAVFVLWRQGRLNMEIGKPVFIWITVIWILWALFHEKLKKKEDELIETTTARIEKSIQEKYNGKK